MAQDNERKETPGACPPFVTQMPGGVRLRVHVQPRASRTALVGRHGTALKISLQAPPVGGEANAALVAFLAQVLGVHRREITITTGASGRSKTVFIAGATALDIAARLGG